MMIIRFLLMATILMSTGMMAALDAAQIDMSHDTLIVSNTPERIKGPGPLCTELIPSAGIRVLYHHVNDAVSTFNFIFSITNNEDKPIQIRYWKGVGGPGGDEIYVGDRAAYRFWRSIVSNNEVVETIPPNSTQIISSHLMRPQSIIAGMFRIVSSGKADLSIAVIDPEWPATSELNQVMNPMIVRRYNSAWKDVTINFSGYPKAIEIPIGDAPFVIDALSDSPLKGNYGVIYNVALQLSNSTYRDQVAHIYFVPVGGVARGVIVINDVITETGVMDTAGQLPPAQIAEIIVPAKSTVPVHIRMFPQGGSFYPINLVVRY